MYFCFLPKVDNEKTSITYLIELFDICSSEFKSFAYLYNEDQFMAALAKDVNIIKTLPKNLKEARRKKKIPLYRVPSSASPYFYRHQVLPMLRKHSVVELVVSDGGCLQVFPLSSSSHIAVRELIAFELRVSLFSKSFIIVLFGTVKPSSRSGRVSEVEMPGCFSCPSISAGGTRACHQDFEKV